MENSHQIEETRVLNPMICNRCHSVFDYTESVEINKKLFGLNIVEKKCPHCGGTFKSVEVPSELDSYLYVDKDDRYYSYPDSRRGN